MTNYENVRGYDYFSSGWECPLRLSVFLEACSGDSLTRRVQEGICDMFLCFVVGTRRAEGRWDSGIRSYTVGQRLRQTKPLYLDRTKNCYPTFTTRGCKKQEVCLDFFSVSQKDLSNVHTKRVFDSTKGGVRVGGTCLLTV